MLRFFDLVLEGPQALLAYLEGGVLLAKGRNDPALIATLREGTLSLMHYQPL